MLPLSREDALRELGLGIGANPTAVELRRLYHSLALKHHPDKAQGRGDNLDAANLKFQRIRAANALLKAAGEAESAGRSDFTAAHHAPASSRPHPARDQTTASPATSFAHSAPKSPKVVTPTKSQKLQCCYCGKSALLIDRCRAVAMGIEWAEYEKHPARLQTCMLCKMAQRSVLSEEQALKKCSSLLPDVFTRLRAEHRSFCINGVAHYWFSELSPGAASAPAAATAGNATAAAAEQGHATPDKERITPHQKRRRDDDSCHVKKPSDAEKRRVWKKLATAGKVGVWRYRVVGDKKVSIREGPDIAAPQSSAGYIKADSAFDVSDRILGVDGRMYLKLADGRGWTYDRSAKDLTKIVVREEVAG